MEKRILKNMVKEQDFTFGIILQILDPDVTESVCCAGFDIVVFDLEHTGKTIESAYPCIMVAYAKNVPALIRTADKDQHFIEQALDAGAQGVVVPTIETVEDCINLVKAAKYAPMGTRGYCPMTATTRWMNHVSSDLLTYANDANRDTFILAMIETPEGIKNLPEMLKVDGIDGFHLGPGDYGMRVGKNVWDPETAKVLEDASELITNAGKISVPIVTSENFEAKYKSGGKVVIVGKGIDAAIQDTYSKMKREMLDIVKACKK
ncbi:MAG: aldolase/citrate lyase family protein [Clostridiales bacterium]|nr:aldolase/citrate lyase family protein [Clostridiales bacterium]